MTFFYLSSVVNPKSGVHLSGKADLQGEPLIKFLRTENGIKLGGAHRSVAAKLIFKVIEFCYSTGITLWCTCCIIIKRLVSVASVSINSSFM